MIYSCIHTVTVGVKGLKIKTVWPKVDFHCAQPCLLQWTCPVSTFSPMSVSCLSG